MKVLGHANNIVQASILLSLRCTKELSTTPASKSGLPRSRREELSKTAVFAHKNQWERLHSGHETRGPKRTLDCADTV